MVPDFWDDLSQAEEMSDPASEFQAEFIARIKALREGRGWSGQQMATALGIEWETYKKYETRSPLPHYLIERFAIIVDRDVEYVLTGRTSKSIGATRARTRATKGASVKLVE